MNRSFIANLSFLIFVNLIVKPLWIFGIDRSVQNTVGEAEYGLYFALFNYTFLFHILLDFGINNFNNRAIARSPEKLASYLPNILLIKLGLAVLYIFLCMAFTYFKPFPWHWLLLMCINQILISFILYFRSNLQGLHLFRRDSVVSILDRSLMIIMCAFLLWGTLLPPSIPFTIAHFIYAQTIAFGITFLVSAYWVFKQIKQWHFKWDNELLFRILKKSYPFALLGLLMSIYNRIDAVMIAALLPEEIGDTQAGIYAAAYRLLDAVNMIGVLFATILLPMFARMLKQKNKSEVTQLVRFSAKTLYAFATIGAISCFFFKLPIMEWLYHDATPYYATIFGYLILSFMAISSVYIYGTLLTANGSLWALNAIAISGVLLNVVLNYYLIPQYQALGATQVTFITQYLVALAHIVVAIKVLALPISVRAIVQVVLFTLACILIAYLAAHQAIISTWQLAFCLALVANVGAAIVFKLLDIKGLIQLVKQR